MNDEMAETVAVEAADRTWARLAELYDAYYRVDSDVVRQRQDVEEHLVALMAAYNAWLA